MTTHTTNLVLDLEHLDWSRRANCFVCHTANIPVSNGVFYEVGSNTPKHIGSTAFHCPHCGWYVVSGSLMASGNADVQIREYLNTHPEYQDAPKVIHTYDVGL